MSLAEKWNEYRATQEFADGGPIERLFEQALREAFYAGAEALWENCGLDSAERQIYKAEIDHFRSHK